MNLKLKKLYSLFTTNYQRKNGYIALISAIVISVLLITITVTLGLNSLFGRFNILDAESKEQSSALAEACVDQAILDASYGTYSTNKVVNVGPTASDNCTIVSSSLSGSQITIKTQSVINKSYTDFKIVVDANTFVTISWQECANIISC